jgi:hypothetical protein
MQKYYKAVVFRNREYRLICVAVIAMRTYFHSSRQSELPRTECALPTKLLSPNTLPLDLFRPVGHN